jgi:cytidylate kinase
MIIAVDGPAASGKGTIARAIAAHFGLPLLDTGLLYRAVGMATVRAGGDPDVEVDALKACQFDTAALADPALRSEAAGGLASRVSVHPGVRAALLKRQRDFAAQPGGAVLDGRDIGTVICPQAEVKLYVTASAEVRAHRRWLEVGGEEAKVLAEVRERDARDIGRTDAPLKAADDAVVIDTSEMTIEAAVARAVGVVKQALRARDSF